MTDSDYPTPCSCGFPDRDAPHILRCTAPPGYNTPRICDRVSPRPAYFMAVAGEGRLP